MLAAIASLPAAALDVFNTAERDVVSRARAGSRVRVARELGLSSKVRISTLKYVGHCMPVVGTGQGMLAKSQGRGSVHSRFPAASGYRDQAGKMFDARHNLLAPCAPVYL